MTNATDTQLLNFIMIPRTEGEIARQLFNGRVLPARHAIRSLIWSGRVQVIGGNRYLARQQQPDFSWLQFQVQYYNF